MPKVWVRNESTGLEREMTESSFKYHESKGKNGSNSLRAKFTFLRKVDEPKSEFELAKARLIAEKAAKEAEKPLWPTSDIPKTEPAKRGPKPKNTEA